MNANFAFPHLQPAVPRPAPAKSSSSPPDLAGSRESNVLRASILDTALELGIGSNPLVADWIFNNPLMEETEEEQEPVPSPGLTYGSSTSKGSVLSPSPLLLHSQYRRDPVVNVNGHSSSLNLNQNVNMPGPLIYQGRNAVPVGSNRISDADSQFSNVRVRFNPNEVASNVNVSNFQKISVNDSVAPFLDIPIPPRPTTPSGKKLKKKRAGGSGYESDGGYVSENGKQKDKKRENSGEAGEGERKKKKSFIQVINKMSTSNDIQSPTKDYETDGGALPSSSKRKGKITKSKTKVPSNEIGYETDGGYQSSSGVKKSKTRFFKLPTKSSRGSLHADASGSVPALPNTVEKTNELIVPLPIAERFATTLSPSSTLRDSILSPTTTEAAGSRMGSPLPTLAFQPFTELTSPMSSPSPVSAGPSAFNRPATAPTSGSPSAFNANATHLDPKNRDSRSSIISSSSSGSGSNQRDKPQKLFGLFSPLHSPPSSMQRQQGPGLRTALSLSSLRPTISLPITRATSPTPARSVSPLPPSVSPTLLTTSVAPLQINKAQRTKPRPDNLPLPTPQYSSSQSVSASPELGSPHVYPAPLSHTPSPGPGYPMVRPKNPPIDGFGPRSAPIPNSRPGSATTPYSPNPGSTSVAPNPSSDALSPHTHTEGHPQRVSQLSIIPSSDYIVPSPRHSPLKMHTPGLPNPTVLAAYYHHDKNVPPPPSPAPMGPLPTLPSSGNGSPAVPNGNGSGSTGQFPSVAQLRQRMTLMRRSVQQDCGFGLSAQRGREPPFPPRPVLSPSQSTVTNGSASVGPESRSGMRRFRDFCPLGNSGVKPGAEVTARSQNEITEETRRAKVAPNRQSWIVFDEDVSLGGRETPEVEEEDQEAEEGAEELYEILDRFENHSNESSDSSSGGRALERSHSFKAGKIEEEQQRHPDSFDARPRQNNKVPADVIARDIRHGFEDDGKTDDGRTVGDRTSRWSGSVYSCASILDQYQSEETRDRFVRRVEAMLDAEKTSKSKALGHHQAQTYIPPLPKMPDVYANITHKKDWNINLENAGVHSNNTPGKSWNRF